MELKKCARCGKFYASDVEVCHECEKKDLADINKLKGFFAEKYVSGVSKNDISVLTGISSRNLNRYLGYEEFSEIYIAGENTENNTEDINSLDEDKISL